jgi:hypothetical protein
METSLLSIIALSAALSGQAPAQSAAPAAVMYKDPVVVMRAEERAAKVTYRRNMAAAHAERKANIGNAGEMAARDAKARGG